jgi:tetratricopeptide (TPR) repeat protein
VLGLSRTRAIPAPIGYKTSRPVRQFIASGNADEKVPDESVFRRQFVAALEGEADLNRDGYVTGTELGEFLQDKVITYTRNTQHPQYGKIRNEFLDKGDFVFQLAKASPRPHVAASPAAPEPSAAEVSFWNSVQNSADPEDFREYLQKYPEGQFAGLARRRLAALTKGAANQPATEAGEIGGNVPGVTPSMNSAVAFLERGLNYSRQGDYDRAIADYTESLRLDPTNAYTYTNRAIAYEAKGDRASAAADRRKARDLLK